MEGKNCSKPTTDLQLQHCCPSNLLSRFAFNACNNLLTSCWQLPTMLLTLTIVMFQRRAVQQLVNDSLTTSYSVVEINRLVTKCFNDLLSFLRQQFVSTLVSHNLSKIKMPSQLADKWQPSYTSLLWTHLVDMLWNFYLCISTSFKRIWRTF